MNPAVNGAASAAANVAPGLDPVGATGVLVGVRGGRAPRRDGFARWTARLLNEPSGTVPCPRWIALELPPAADPAPVGALPGTGSGVPSPGPVPPPPTMPRAQGGIDRLDAAAVVAAAAARGIPVRECPEAAAPAGAVPVRHPAVGATSRRGAVTGRELRGLLRLRHELGLAMLDKSPIFWSVAAYRLSERLLGAAHKRPFGAIADLIPAGTSVTDLCCGPADLYTQHLKAKGCAYVGMDFNGRFRRALRRSGIDYRFVRLPNDPIAPADVVVMCSSLYHFHERADELLDRMRDAARLKVIVAEPVENLSNHPVRALGWLANRLTAPGVGRYDFRYDLPAFRQFARRNDAEEFVVEPGGATAIAVFGGSR